MRPNTGPRPCSAAEAVERALSLVGKGGEYQLGTGDFHPFRVGHLAEDLPWTRNSNGLGSDCAGFAISWCFKLRRHRPGYNRGRWATVADDLNCNSAIEDAEHGRELFDIVTGPILPGDLLCYPTFRAGLTLKRFIGHVGIVTGTKRWNGKSGRYDLLDVAQCCGPNGRSPAVLATDGHVWAHHDAVWPQPRRQTRVLRAIP